MHGDGATLAAGDAEAGGDDLDTNVRVEENPRKLARPLAYRDGKLAQLPNFGTRSLRTSNASKDENDEKKEEEEEDDDDDDDGEEELDGDEEESQEASGDDDDGDGDEQDSDGDGHDDDNEAQLEDLEDTPAVVRPRPAPAAKAYAEARVGEPRPVLMTGTCAYTDHGPNGWRRCKSYRMCSRYLTLQLCLRRWWRGGPRRSWPKLSRASAPAPTPASPRATASDCRYAHTHSPSP
jgi:hypothetical protein